MEIDSRWVVAKGTQPTCKMNDVEAGLGWAHPGAILAMFVCQGLCIVIVFCVLFVVLDDCDFYTSHLHQSVIKYKFV